MVELQLHYFCCHGKHTKQKNPYFLLNDTYARYTSNSLAAGLHDSKVASIPEGVKKPPMTK